MNEVYTKNTEPIASSENSLAFLIDYFQDLKEREPVIVLQANKAIELLHMVKIQLTIVQQSLKPKL